MLEIDGATAAHHCTRKRIVPRVIHAAVGVASRPVSDRNRRRPARVLETKIVFCRDFSDLHLRRSLYRRIYQPTALLSVRWIMTSWFGAKRRHLPRV
jgi:hypothetical protein